jgi:hypothetical protein
VRIDPTAAVAPERVFDTIQDRARASGDLLSQPAARVRHGDWMVSAWNDFVLGFNADRQRRLLQPWASMRSIPNGCCCCSRWSPIAALATTVWLLSRDVRERDPLLRAWHRVGKRYAKLGLGRAPHEPASEWAQRVHRARARGDDALLALGTRFQPPALRSAREAGERLNALLRDLDAHRP